MTGHGKGPGTLRGRLALIAVAATAGWVALTVLVVSLLLGSQLDREADSVLRSRAAAAATTVHVTSAGRLVVREPADDSALDAGIWIFAGNRAVERARAAPGVQRAARRLASRGSGFADARLETVRLYARPVESGGRTVGTVVAATDLGPYRRTTRTVLVVVIALALLFLATEYVVARRVVARALQPVAEMAEQAQQWSAHDVAARFGSSDRPEELDALASDLDALLDRLAAVLRHEQQVAADLSHELRTPLSLIVAENELLAGGNPDPKTRAAGHAVIADTADRMNRLIETLLGDAADAMTKSPGRARLADLVRDATDTADGVRPVGNTATTTVDVPEGISVGVAADVLARILAPVLGNAYRYARSDVTITGKEHASGVEIVVHDDGPGVPDTFRADLFVPGRRAATDDGHPGAGLGLALARRLARSCGGDLEHVAGPGSNVSGATFRITLPRG